MPTISTRLTELLGIRYPIISAPMGFAAGGKLASAVSAAGGLGLIGGGYGDSKWLENEFNVAAGARIGVGFITWSLQKQPALLTQVLERKPLAVMLSFGDPRPFVNEIRKAGALLICQCQNRQHILDAIEVGADIIVAQGSEAGGHGAIRTTFTLVPEAADIIAEKVPKIVLAAAGGVADGRGLVAALALGAEGVLIGTRFWASTEALVHPNLHAAIVTAQGDDTLRTHVADIARQHPWAKEFTGRLRKNQLTAKWHGRESDLEKNLSTETPAYWQAFDASDVENIAVWSSEAVSMINNVAPAAEIIDMIMKQASDCLERLPK